MEGHLAPTDPMGKANDDGCDSAVEKLRAEIAASQCPAAQLKEAIEAVRRLVEVALHDSGQCRHIARFLLGLYNGPEYPFDLTRLRALDTNLADDCLSVLKADARGWFRKEIHLFFENGGKLFNEIGRLHGVKPCRPRRAR